MYASTGASVTCVNNTNTAVSCWQPQETTVFITLTLEKHSDDLSPLKTRCFWTCLVEDFESLLLHMSTHRFGVLVL